jgi:hypothetical protein
MKATLLTNDYTNALSAHSESPCLSLYQPTHRHHPDNQQDSLRFRHLVKELEKALATKYPAGQIQSLLKPFEDLGGNRDFWNHTLDGLAVLASPGVFQVYGMQRSVPELTVVAETFHTKPLRRFLQSTDRFQVLCLSRHAIRLLEGNRDALDEIELGPGVPRTITDALGGELTEPHQTVAAYGGTGRGSTAMHHGHGGQNDETDVDAERYFRAVDRAVLERYSRPAKLPLLLAALPEHHSLFRKISHNPFLLPDGIKLNPEALSVDDLREHAWRVFEPRHQKRLMELADDYAVAKSKNLGMDSLPDIASAAVAGRISTLLIEAGREIAGRIDVRTGDLQLTDLNHPEADDVLDDLGELVVKNGGVVVVVPSELMPTGTGAAATCRYEAGAPKGS